MKTTITKEIAEHPLNENLNLTVGGTIGGDEDCNGKKKPPVQAGMYGEYICNGNEWVFIPE